MFMFNEKEVSTGAIESAVYTSTGTAEDARFPLLLASVTADNASTKNVDALLMAKPDAALILFRSN